MTLDEILAFVLFAVVAAITPGPSNIILASTGANAGVLRGLPCLFGVATGMGIMVFVVAFGLGSLILDNPLVLTALKWAGIAFLLWLSWKIATAGRSDERAGAEIVGFWGAAVFQWFNPKSWLVSASAVAAYLQADANAFVQSASFGLLFALTALPCCLIWLAFGASMQRWLGSDRTRTAFNRAMAVLLAGSTVFFVW
jgi:threonine/homoserine/homoserine lactone efflux protein